MRRKKDLIVENQGGSRMTGFEIIVIGAWIGTVLWFVFLIFLIFRALLPLYYEKKGIYRPGIMGYEIPVFFICAVIVTWIYYFLQSVSEFRFYTMLPIIMLAVCYCEVLKETVGVYLDCHKHGIVLNKFRKLKIIMVYMVTLCMTGIDLLLL